MPQDVICFSFHQIRKLYIRNNNEHFVSLFYALQGWFCTNLVV